MCLHVGSPSDARTGNKERGAAGVVAECLCLRLDQTAQAWTSARVQAILQALLRRARQGDVRAFADLANRVEGRPPQAVRLEGGRLLKPCRRA